ncbi:hypothetical protein [Novosphingobium kaempferiae]|uniref:hypothetical protein n=1 Tax=Novosphingobium kaempferiae TaxID=2896849 RepID=UPI001E3716FE|nr:hypothetical protein [Novosphingobium kaempferiae]
MRTKAALAIILSGSLLALAACGKAGEDPAVLESASAEVDSTDAVVDAGPVGDATGAPAVANSNLDAGALTERRDPERLLRYYVSAVRAGDWSAAADAWSLDAQMTPAKLEQQLGSQKGPRLAIGKGDMEGAAGSLYYEAPIVVDFGDGRPSKRGTIVLRRVNDVPGASDNQLNWRIERTSTLTQ